MAISSLEPMTNLFVFLEFEKKNYYKYILKMSLLFILYRVKKSSINWQSLIKFKDNIRRKIVCIRLNVFSGGMYFNDYDVDEGTL